VAAAVNVASSSTAAATTAASGAVWGSPRAAPKAPVLLEEEEEDGGSGDEAYSHMSPICPLDDQHLPMDADSLKSKQARPLAPQSPLEPLSALLGWPAVGREWLPQRPPPPPRGWRADGSAEWQALGGSRGPTSCQTEVVCPPESDLRSCVPQESNLRSFWEDPRQGGCRKAPHGAPHGAQVRWNIGCLEAIGCLE
jgi:hypothetical protein